MNNCMWSGCTDDALPGGDLCKKHQRIVDKEAQEARRAVVYKNDDLTHHADKGHDWRHGERTK